MILSKWWYAFALFLSLGGFYLTQNLPNDWNVKAMFWVAQFFAVTLWTAVDINLVMYQAYVTRFEWPWSRRQKNIVPTTEPIYDHNTGAIVGEMPIKADSGQHSAFSTQPLVSADGFMPLGRANGKPVLRQVVDLPRFDKERNFAVTLLRMYDYDPEQVDLSEGKWVRNTKKFIRAEFISMLENWKEHGIIERKSNKKNASYTVVDWRAVRVIAEGHPLPPMVR